MTDFNGKWNLDASHSEVGFVVRHAGISKVRGKFEFVEAVLESDAELNGTVSAKAKADTFNSGDENRDGHIKSADFLDVENYPTLDFSGRINGETLSGTLTIRGVSQDVVFDIEDAGTAVDPFGNLRAGFEAKTTISRKDFGLTWNAALETGGVLVSDKVVITLDVSFIKDTETE